MAVPERRRFDLWRFYCPRELFLFIGFGGTAALVNLFSGWLLYGAGLVPGLPYWCATAIAAFLGLFVNFMLNYGFNFGYRERTAIQQFSTFCIVSGFGVVLTSAVSEGLLLLFERLGGPGMALLGLRISAKFAAHLLAVLVVVFYSFPAHKAISFNVGLYARLQQLKLLLAGVR